MILIIKKNIQMLDFEKLLPDLKKLSSDASAAIMTIYDSEFFF